MAISEKIELLGKGLYENIPDELTLTGMPTSSELDYVGSEDFEETMLDNILPKCIKETINTHDLLEIDFYWVCRCLRLLNFGPYHTTNRIYCTECGETSVGEYRVNLNTVPCKPLPAGFVNNIEIKRDAFMDFEGDVTIKLPTIQRMISAFKDKAFQGKDGMVNRELARICYMITSIKGQKGITPLEIKLLIQKEFSAADYILLKDEVRKLTDYGLRAGGSTVCPKCGATGAGFIALTDDRYFRPNVGDLREWKHDRNSGRDKDVFRNKKADV